VSSRQDGRAAGPKRNQATTCAPTKVSRSSRQKLSPKAAGATHASVRGVLSPVRMSYYQRSGIARRKGPSSAEGRPSAVPPVRQELSPHHFSRSICQGPLGTLRLRFFAMLTHEPNGVNTSQDDGGEFAGIFHLPSRLFSARIQANSKSKRSADSRAPYLSWRSWRSLFDPPRRNESLPVVGMIDAVHRYPAPGIGGMDHLPVAHVDGNVGDSLADGAEKHQIAGL